MAVEMQSVDILDCYSALEDPRQRTKVIYPLPEILLLVLCGVMAGADDFSEITRWGKLHVEFLRRFLPYREGIPSHDTVNAVIAALDGEAFRDAFVSWVAGLRAADQDGKVIAIDHHDYRLAKSMEQGATHVINSNKQDPIKAVKELTGGLGADVVVEAAGQEETVNQIKDLVKLFGTVALFGLPEEPMIGEDEADLDGAAIASLEPGTMQVLLPGEDVKFSSPADVGGGYEAFQYRTLLAVSASLGLPYHLVTGDVRQANYSSLRAELVEFRRRVQQLQHGVIAHQLCRPVWARWLETAQLAGRLDLSDPAAARMVQWIPPRWDWVDPLKDIQAQVLAMEAGITSRRKVVEATGYDVEEVDRENATDTARAEGLGLRYRTSPGETQGARATPATRPDPGDGADEATGEDAAATDRDTNQE